MKKIIKYILKKMLNAGEKETVADAIDRNKSHFLKRINKKHYNSSDLKKILLNLGLQSGDTVIVHSAWRRFIGFDGTPQDVIDCIKSIIGDSGNILMPAFTNNTELFKYDDKSSAGVITEVFRNNTGVNRSLNNMFSMCSYGQMTPYYLNEHVNSLYGFDDNSPYYKAIQNNTKILLLGMGRKPHKITMFHCISYKLRKKVKCYNNVYTVKKKVTLIDSKNNKVDKIVIDRNPKYQNNKKKFRYLFKKFIKKSNYKRLNFLDIYLFDSKIMYENVYNYIINNNYNIYKK